MVFLDDDTAYLIDFDFCRVMDEVKPPLYIEGYAVERLPRHAHARESNPCFKSTTSIHFGSVGWLYVAKTFRGDRVPAL
jgi:hypothetical protein